MDSDQIMGSDLSRGQAQQIIARAYGFSNWNEIRSSKNLKYDQDFQTTVDSVVEGRIDELRSIVARKPKLVRDLSTAIELRYCTTLRLTAWNRIAK